jgi:uncharacterized membrane protein
MSIQVKEKQFERIGNHYRIIFSMALTLIVFFLIRHAYRPSMVFMVSWICFAASSLILTWITIFTSHPAEVRTIAKIQDPSRTLIFLFVIFSAFISLFAIIVLLNDLPKDSKRGVNVHLLLSIASVVLSWLLIHTLFTLRYAHMYYTCRYMEKGIEKERVGGLDFPSEDEPDYLDFAYFSFVIGMTFQVSDVEISSRNIRRVALLHGLLSFVYNTVIVAFSINIISGVMSK